MNFENFKHLKTNENGLNKENDLLIGLNTDLIEYALKKDKNNRFKIIEFLNNANKQGNKYNFVVTSVILDLNNTNDFETFKKLCIKSVKDLNDFKDNCSDIDLNNAFVYVYENSYQYIVYNNSDFENFLRDYILYNYYNEFLFDLFVLLSSLI